MAASETFQEVALGGKQGGSAACVSRKPEKPEGVLLGAEVGLEVFSLLGVPEPCPSPAGPQARGIM